MTLHTYNPNPNAFVGFMRKVYRPIGFKKGYNFVLWFIFSGAFFGFLLARLTYLDINGKFKEGTAPGEWYYYKENFYKIGITLHLATLIPGGLLAILQFVPFIRYKATLFHRINGYIVILLLILLNVGALMIGRHAFGGTMATQGLVGTLAIATLGSAFLAYINIKRLQIDQHRAWMLRCWVYAGTIITTRIILILSAIIVSSIGGFYIAMPCKQLSYMGGDASNYPACAADSNGYTAVEANFNDPQGVEEVAAAMQMSFGMAGWIALMLHVIGIEVYLKLTPAENERLRQVSYERQLERGFNHPGRAGLTVDRLGDAEEWKPRIAETAKETKEETSDHEPTGFRQAPEQTVQQHSLGWR